MKLATDNSAEAMPASATNELSLPEGLVGFPEIKKAEILFAQEELPFMRLHDASPDGHTFLVVEPHGLVPDYKIEILDLDEEYLQLKNPEDAMVLVVATLHREPSMRVTLNLVGPIVVNRRTRVGKQVVIANYEDYDSRYPLYKED